MGDVGCSGANPQARRESERSPGESRAPALGFRCRVVCQGHPWSLPALVLVLGMHLLPGLLMLAFPFQVEKKKKINPSLSA